MRNSVHLKVGEFYPLSPEQNAIFTLESGEAYRLRETYRSFARENRRQKREIERHLHDDAYIDGVTETLQSFTCPLRPVEDKVVQDSEYELLTEAIRSLPERQRTCFLLCFVYGYSQREVAVMYGVKPSAICQTVRIAKRKFQEICKTALTFS